MFDKKSFEMFSSFKYSDEELVTFIKNVKTILFDIDNPFEKFFSVKVVKKCIKMYLDKRISLKYFNHFLVAYEYVISGGYNDVSDNVFSIKEMAVCGILDVLDSFLVYIDNKEETSYYIKYLKTLESVYKNYDKWEVYYSTPNRYYDNLEVNDIHFVLKNKNKKVYVKVYVDYFDTDIYRLDNSFIKVDNACDLEKQLKQQKYKEL